MITLFLEELLTPTGMEVAAFNSSIEALSAIRQAPQSFDLIVTDQLMPELTGMAFVEALRKLNADVPVILLTGLSAAIDADRIARLGVNQLLTKPIDLKAFFATLKRLLKSQDADARLHRP
jgi:CheY-like chemotaxis protein